MSNIKPTTSIPGHANDGFFDAGLVGLIAIFDP